MSTLSIDDIHAADAMLQRHRAARPSDFYRPGVADRPPADNGQLQFHMAPHIFRLLATGNGFGKSTCVAVEVDWWVQHTHPYQDTPDRPIQVAWLCKKYGQFEMMKPKLEQWFAKPFGFNGTYNYYEWDNGGKMHVLSDDSLWETVQGIEPDLIVVDEECNLKIWRELKMRRRAGTGCRFVVSATATRGLQWMYSDLYRPWLDFHAARGLTEGQAMQQQQHEFPEPELAGIPGIWCWPKGGAADNPANTPADVAFYRMQKFGSAAERRVRLEGGFADFSGQPVFHPDNLELLRKLIQQPRVGAIELNPEYDAKQPQLAPEAVFLPRLLKGR